MCRSTCKSSGINRPMCAQERRSRVQPLPRTPVRACPVRASQSDRVRDLSSQLRASMLGGRQEVVNVKLQPQAERAFLRVSPAAVPRPHALACAGGELGCDQSRRRVDRKGALRCWPRSQALHAPRVWPVPCGQSLSWHHGRVGGRCVAVRVQPVHGSQNTDTRVELPSCR